MSHVRCVNESCLKNPTVALCYFAGLSWRCVITHVNLPTEEIRLKIFGSPDPPGFPATLLNDGDSRLLTWKTVWKIRESRENLCEVTGTPVKTCWHGGSHNYLKSDLLRLWYVCDRDSRLLTRTTVWKNRDSGEKLFEVTTTPVKTGWNCGSHNYLKSDILRLWYVWYKNIQVLPSLLGMSRLETCECVIFTYVIEVCLNDQTVALCYFACFTCVWHDTFMCLTWLIHMCNMTHSYVWHDTFICVTWLIHMCDMTHSQCDIMHHITRVNASCRNINMSCRLCEWTMP